MDLHAISVHCWRVPDVFEGVTNNSRKYRDYLFAYSGNILFPPDLQDNIANSNENPQKFDRSICAALQPASAIGALRQMGLGYEQASMVRLYM